MNLFYSDYYEFCRYVLNIDGFMFLEIGPKSRPQIEVYDRQGKYIKTIDSFEVYMYVQHLYDLENGISI